MTKQEFPLAARKIQCGLREYGNRDARCPDNASEILDIEIDDGTVLRLPMCEHHASTWPILIGHKGIAQLIRDGKLFFIENEK